MPPREETSCEVVWNFRHLVVTIEVRLKPRYFCSSHDHLELRVVEPERHPLPVTPTGYKSIWPAHGEYSSAESAAEAILSWLDEESKNPDWLELVSELEQPTLF